MNDCLWAFICNVCTCEYCGIRKECEEYISVNSEEGRNLLRKYQEDVEEALQHVYAKWRKYKESGVYGRN